MTNKAVAKKEKNEVAEYNPALMDEMTIDTKDILLSRVLCMQPTSELVGNGKATVGELRDSVSGKLLCKKEEAVEIILYNPFKTWVTFTDDVFTSVVPYTPENADWIWEEKIGDKKVTRKQVLNYYVALPEDIKKGDYIPKVIGFQSTAYKTGRKIESKRLFLAKFKKPLAAHVFEITTIQKENEKGRWFIPDVSEKRDTTTEELNAISEWAQIMKTKNVEIDDSEFEKNSKGEEYTGREF